MKKKDIENTTKSISSNLGSGVIGGGSLGGY